MRFEHAGQAPERESSPSLEGKIELAIAEGRARTVGKGSTGDVLVIASRNTGEELPWVVKTRTNDPPSHTSERATFQTEWIMHQRAQKILDDARAEKPNIAKIPRPIGITQTESSQRIILEYIPGETLFERSIRFLLLRYADDEEAEKIRVMNKVELVELVTTEDYLGLFPESVQRTARWARRQQNADPLTEEDFPEILDAIGRNLRCGDSPLLSRAQYQQLENAIAALHAERVAHADFHPSNIMMQPDGTMVILDFGLSKKVPSETNKRCREDKEYLAQYKKIAL